MLTSPTWPAATILDRADTGHHIQEILPLRALRIYRSRVCVLLDSESSVQLKYHLLRSHPRFLATWSNTAPPSPPVTSCYIPPVDLHQSQDHYSFTFVWLFFFFFNLPNLTVGSINSRCLHCFTQSYIPRTEHSTWHTVGVQSVSVVCARHCGWHWRRSS